MKIRFLAALLLAALALPVLTGCAAVNALPQNVDTPELTVSPTAAPRTVLPDPTPAATPAATGPSHTSAETTQLISKEEAEKIALEHAGFTADQVQRLRTELDYDRGRAEYEVDFHVDRWEYDYEIDAETGTIVSYDKDWDD